MNVRFKCDLSLTYKSTITGTKGRCLGLWIGLDGIQWAMLEWVGLDLSMNHDWFRESELTVATVALPLEQKMGTGIGGGPASERPSEAMPEPSDVSSNTGGE